MPANDTPFSSVIPILRESRLRIAFVSAVLLIPCLWHPRIEAGDLASHVYNAWLAQLIGKGQAPGLYLASQWNNILFDYCLWHTANVVGFPAAQQIVVGACVLIFFWGVFALIAAITDRLPWFLTPCIAMLAYGYSFNMGFLNYYLSIGLACFSLAFFWRRRGIGWIAGIVLGPLVLLAHPIGFVWLIGSLAYLQIRKRLPGRWKLGLPLAAAAGLLAFYWYLAHNAARFTADWDRGPFYLYNGADQLALYGQGYVWLAAALFFFGVFCVAFEAVAEGRENRSWKPSALLFELYFVSFFATVLLPENLRVSLYAGWVGMLSSRLTTISAIFGLCILGFLKPRKWHVAGFGMCAIVFFGSLYQDTKWLNQLEANAESLVRSLPPGTRVIPTIWAPAGSRVAFIGHVVDRACIGYCFNYANYEPSSRQFRVRVRPGSRVVTDSSDDSEDMSAGQYHVQDEDLPLKQIYQCDPADLTKLCIRDLQAGEKNGRIGYHPPE
jgi:hypothetical protein